MKKDTQKNITIKRLPKSKVEIVGTISAEDFGAFRKQALENINNEVSIDGFRKGKVPEATLVAKVGEMTILEEMAELAISEAYPQIIMEEKIDAIGRPEINITKIADGNPLEFKITTTVLPEIKLGEYTKISKEHASAKEEVFEVTDKEVEDALEKIKKSHKDHTGHDHDSPKAREELKKYLLEDKKVQAVEKRRIAISDALVKSTEFEIPELLVESELRRIEAQFNDDIARMGVKITDYLNHAKKTIEDIRKEWRPSAEKKARLQLIINEIAKKEKIEVPVAQIEIEVGHIIEHYKDANREHAYTYAETVLTNEKVFQFLEGSNSENKLR